MLSQLPSMSYAFWKVACDQRGHLFSLIYVTHSQFRPNSNLECQSLIAKAFLDLLRGYTETSKDDVVVIVHSKKKRKLCLISERN